MAGDADSEDPVASAEAMVAAAIAGDCAGVVGHLTPEAYGPGGETEEEAVAACTADPDRAVLRDTELVGASLVSESGDAAVVAVTLAVGGEERARDIPMERLEGEWKVAIPAR